MEINIHYKLNNKYLILVIGLIILIIIGGIYLYTKNLSGNQISSNVVSEQNSSQPETDNAVVENNSDTDANTINISLDTIVNSNETVNNTVNETVVEIPPAPILPQTYTVDIIKMKIMNKTITINKGDTVMWVNYDSVPHRLMSDLGNEISGKAFYKNQNWTHKFNDAGTYSYYCTVYPYVQGTVIVQ